jgi:hypothetical protein
MRIFLLSAVLAARFVAQPTPVARVPFDLVDNRIVLHVTLNGRGPYALILDTGADQGLRDGLARELGVSTTSAEAVTGTGEKALAARSGRVADMAVGPVHIRDLGWTFTSFADFPPVFGTYRIDGVVGSPIFNRYVVRIDYAARTLTLYDPKTFEYHGEGVVVPIDIVDGYLPIADGAVDGTAGRFVLDIGARTALILNGPFVETHHLRERYELTPATVNGWGAGGPIRAQVGRVRQLTFGGAVVSDVVTRFSVQRAGALTSSAVAGLIGPDVLSQFVDWFDYSRHRLIVERAASYGRRDTYDRSGMWLGQEPGNADFVVIDVMAGGPASTAGLTVGDRVVAIDGQPTSVLLLPTARLRMRTDSAGTPVRLRVVRAGDAREVTIVLRDVV